MTARSRTFPYIALAVLLTSLLARARLVVERVTVDGKPVVVVKPDNGPGPWPVVYLLAGLGEMKRGPAASAAGWIERYGLLEGLDAVSRGSLEADHFGGLVDGALLDAYQRRQEAGYRGLVLVCVAAPVDYSRAFERHLLEEVIPWAERALPIRRGAAMRGIDGISLGGRFALRLAFRHPYEFRTVGTEQAAVRNMGPELVRLVRKNPVAARTLVVNLLTSGRDPYRVAIAELASRLRLEGLRVRHGVVPGGHDKRFAKGPGVIDMLLFHDAVLNKTTTDPEPFGAR